MNESTAPDNRPAVLILAHSWPPDANVGAVRPVYLSRQLARLGLRPIVITVRDEYYELRNESGISGSESALVIRTKCLRHPRYAYLWMKKLAVRLLGNRNSAPHIQTAQVGPLSDVRPFGSNLKANILSLLFTPDEFIGWFPFALAEAVRIVSKERPLCVISTGPPHSVHLTALVLNRLRRVPWIADLRDPWAWYDLPVDPPELWSDWMNAKLEKLMVRYATRMVCVTPAVTTTYKDKYPDSPPDKWVTIPNGFDLDEFDGLGIVSRAERFTISYVGGFDHQRSPDLLLKAIAELISNGTLDPERIAVRFVGTCEYTNGRHTAALIREFGLSDIANVVSLLPRPQALRELLSAHVLLLLAGDHRLSVAAKVYEYLASGQPILAISNEGSAADIIRRTGAGRVVAPNDLEGAKSAIAHWYGNYLKSGSAIETGKPELSSATREYSWDQLGARYAELIQRAQPSGH